MKSKLLIASILMFVSAAHMAMAEGDISPGVAGNKIVTGSWDDDAGVYAAPAVNAYEFEFGEEPLDPFFVDDPGFRAKDAFFPAEAVAFIPNATLRFNILSDLLYWDGSGVENFGAAPAGSLLTLEKGSFSVTIGAGETLPKTGLLIGTSNAAGEFHEHIGSTISNSFGDPLPGFYRFDMQLLTDAPGIASSDPISITYGLVPEPVSLLLLAAGFGLALGRRRAQIEISC